MKKFIQFGTGITLILLAGCASRAELPPERLAASEAAVRSAEQAGADSVENPSSQLHIRMARDQLNLAKRALDDGQTHRADMLLIRARVDAELAQTLAQQTNTKNEADKVQTEVRELRAQLTEPRNPQPASATTETPPVPKVEDEDTVIED